MNGAPVFIGIDPGLTGAVAQIDDVGNARVFDIPIRQKKVETAMRAKVVKEIDAHALSVLLRELAPVDRTAQAYVEEVFAIDGGFGIQSQASLVDSFGQIKATLRIMRIELELVVPRRWKGFYGLGSSKKESLEKARKLYPRCEGLERAKDDGRAEALLIAHYGMRNHSAIV